MTLEFIKLISALLYPLGLSLCFLLVAVFSWLLGWKKVYRTSLILSVTIVLFFSLPVVAKNLAGKLESQYPAVALKDMQTHDAIVVLGGGLRIPTPPANRLQLGATSDRYLYASELYNEGKASKIVLAGGNFYKQDGLQGEAFYAMKLLQQWSIQPQDILVDQESRNTEENRNNANTLLKRHGLHTIILVTSALHMPRAMSLFGDSGLAVTPGVADQQVRTAEISPWQPYIPSVHALQLNTAAIHEYYGLLFLRIKKLIGH